jgi:hypothetical protein
MLAALFVFAMAVASCSGDSRGVRMEAGQGGGVSAGTAGAGGVVANGGTTGGKGAAASGGKSGNAGTTGAGGTASSGRGGGAGLAGAGLAAAGTTGGVGDGGSGGSGAAAGAASGSNPYGTCTDATDCPVAGSTCNSKFGCQPPCQAGVCPAPPPGGVAKTIGCPAMCLLDCSFNVMCPDGMHCDPSWFCSSQP